MVGLYFYAILLHRKNKKKNGYLGVWKGLKMGYFWGVFEEKVIYYIIEY